MTTSNQDTEYSYTPEDLDGAVRAMLEHMSTDKATDTKTANVRAAAAMLQALGKASGGVVIKGCCTQGCCDEVVFKMIEDMK